jgi:hypothetical protein
MSAGHEQRDEWGITGIQKVRIEFDENWAEGFNTDVVDGQRIKILNEKTSVEPPDHVGSSSSVEAIRMQTGWIVDMKWLYDRGNKEETRSFEVDDVNVEVL